MWTRSKPVQKFSEDQKVLLFRACHWYLVKIDNADWVAWDDENPDVVPGWHYDVRVTDDRNKNWTGIPENKIHLEVTGTLTVDAWSTLGFRFDDKDVVTKVYCTDPGQRAEKAGIRKGTKITKILKGGNNVRKTKGLSIHRRVITFRTTARQSE